MKRILKNRKLILSIVNTIIVGFVLSLTIVSYTYSWYVRQERKNGVGVTTGSTSLLNMKMYTYTTSDEGTEGWVAKNIQGESGTKTDSKGYPADGLPLDNIVTPEDASFTAFHAISLHFGTVDNLVSLKPDNYLYFRFDIDSSVYGKNVIFKEKLAADSFKLYDRNDALVNDTVSSGLTTLIGSLDVLSYSYCVTTTAIAETTEGFSNATFVDFTKTTDTYNDFYMNYSYEGTGTYYLYIRINPNLTSFSSIAKQITSKMPCVLLWNVDMEIEIY